MAHIKFLRHGTGSAQKAVKYLTESKEGRRETVLRGDPWQMAMVADSLTTRYRYSSAIIGFAPEDRPTPEQIDRCLDDFRMAMGPGLDESRLEYTVVRHDEPGNRIALHLLCARVDLETGKSYNPAPPGWRKRYDLIRDAWNYEHGWARPDDPERARLIQPGDRAYVEAENLRKGVEESDDPKKLVTEYLTQRIEAGLISDRNGVIEALKEAGFEINRQGQDYLSIKDKESGQKIRLKGVIYESGFRTEKLEGSGDSPEGKEREGSACDTARSRECRLEFEERLKKISEYNQKRYRKNGDKEMDLDLGRDFGRCADRGRSPLSDPAVSQIRDRGDKIGIGTVEIVPNDRKIATFASGKGDPESERALACDRQDGSTLATDAPRSGMGTDVQDFRRNGTVPDRGEVAHDRGGADIDGSVREVCRRSRAIIKREGSAIRAFEQSDRRLRDGIEKIRECADRLVDSIGRNLGRIKKWAVQKIDAEMERFKREINLAEFARTRGYAKEKGSSKNGLILKGLDGDRIVVATNSPDNHGVYFNVHDQKDSGSVVDFVKRRTGLNFLQIRKELRSWLGSWRKEEYARPFPSTSDQQKIMRDVAGMSREPNAFLMKDREISAKILADPRFVNQVLTDSGGRAIFPHYHNGLTGYEVENLDINGFSPGGERGLWYSHGLGGKSKRITICKSGVDCLSHAQMHPNHGSDYVSIAGTISVSQKSDLGMIARVASRVGIEIIVAVENNPEGEKLAEELAGIFEKEGVETLREIPEHGKDWNENLQHREEEACTVAKVGW